MVRVVTLDGIELLFSVGFSSASDFAFFEESFLGLGARGFLDAFCSALVESSGKSFAGLVFILVDERVMRLFGSGVEPGSEVLRFGGMSAVN